jgi:hypothetical protein
MLNKTTTSIVRSRRSPPQSRFQKKPGPASRFQFQAMHKSASQDCRKCRCRSNRTPQSDWKTILILRPRHGLMPSCCQLLNDGQACLRERFRHQRMALMPTALRCHGRCDSQTHIGRRYCQACRRVSTRFAVGQSTSKVTLSRCHGHSESPVMRRLSQLESQ